MAKTASGGDSAGCQRGGADGMMKSWERCPLRSLDRLRVVARFLPRLRRPTFRSLGLQSHGLCHACGTVTEFDVRELLWPALVTEWRLTPAMKGAFDRRESGT